MVKVALLTGFVLVAVIAASVVALVLFPDPFVNSMIKPALVREWAGAMPHHDLSLGALKVSVLGNRVEVDTFDVRAHGASWSASGGPVVVSGIDWWSVIWRRSLVPGDLAATILESRDLVLHLPDSVYELRCDSLRVSVADSTIAINSLAIYPVVDDEPLFASGPSRKTRLRMKVSRLTAEGVACLDLIAGQRYVAGSVRLEDALFDILINKDKPSPRTSTYPRMPNELLMSIGVPLHLDSLLIADGTLLYGERFGVGTRPGVITLENMQVHVGGIANTTDSGNAMVLHATGQFMHAGEMRIRMIMPIDTTSLSYSYAGSLGSMGLPSLNAFLERAEQLRITNGTLQEATFDIVVTSGRATGTVRALYRDLTIAMIDRHTGSEAGIMDGLASFIANRFKIRGTNVRNGSDKATIGVVKYSRKREEAFLEFTWFALRSGVGDVAGF